ncbi:maleylpyruvate isomerase N-terminal domain-containing protein [Janibacter limosus]|uniref:Maleylpyruvate isomerase N-terminal domain-containing protein n=1 Tax=Janibacter limosus TaxID=53458 RepID=A0AC61U2G1_9MICO|nr:maleylpyruvate isomerase N-terminal domain-containing protein [Janibacter limosus]UUZ44188.1 maleylpyruvate isomerase N-terminal domain-containing protein [Janibacter limosus]
MTSLTEMSVVDRYRSAASSFSDKVAGTHDWDAPTPVAEWRARDVVGHLTTRLPALVSSGSPVTFEPVPSADEDPVSARAQTDASAGPPGGPGEPRDHLRPRAHRRAAAAGHARPVLRQRRRLPHGTSPGPRAGTTSSTRASSPARSRGCPRRAR